MQTPLERLPRIDVLKASVGIPRKLIFKKRLGARVLEDKVLDGIGNISRMS
jgi:hypothetical protein